MIKKAKYTIWGKDLDPAAILQMDDAVSLPVAVKGALMPNAHKGYGRKMSRNTAKKLFNFKDLQNILQKKQISIFY